MDKALLPSLYVSLFAFKSIKLWQQYIVCPDHKLILLKIQVEMSYWTKIYCQGVQYYGTETLSVLLLQTGLLAPSVNTELMGRQGKEQSLCVHLYTCVHGRDEWTPKTAQSQFVDHYKGSSFIIQTMPKFSPSGEFTNQLPTLFKLLCIHDHLGTRPVLFRGKLFTPAGLMTSFNVSVVPIYSFDWLNWLL